jgi:Ca2+/Na+ antiporter
MAFRLGAVQTLTLSARSLVIGREGVGLKFRTSPGNENTRKRLLFYFILFYFILFYFILFYFILFYFILFYFILFYFILYRYRYRYRYRIRLTNIPYPCRVRYVYDILSIYTEESLTEESDRNKDSNFRVRAVVMILSCYYCPCVVRITAKHLVI